MPDREARLGALLDIVEAVAGPAPAVLDLACGTGSITRRLLARLPRARVVAVDVDAALLAIAGASIGTDERVQVVQADVTATGWADALPVPEGGFDAVVSATALHWLTEPELRRLYGDLRLLVRPGGVVANADDMPPSDLPRLGEALEGLAEHQRDEVRTDGRPDWAAWWDEVAADPALAGAVAERQRFFGGVAHPASFNPPERWHVAALEAAGFAEAGVAWRQGPGAVAAAVR